MSGSMSTSNTGQRPSESACQSTSEASHRDPVCSTSDLRRELHSLGASIVPAFPYPIDHSCAAEQLRSICSNYGDSAIPSLLEIVNDKNLAPQLRAVALRALGCLDCSAEQILPTAIDSLSDPDPAIRWMGTEVLRKRESEAAVAVEPLLRLLSDDNLVVRQDAIFALGCIKDDRAIGAIASFLCDSSKYFQRSAVMALGKFGSAASPHLPKLRELAEGDDWVIAINAKAAIDSITKTER